MRAKNMTLAGQERVIRCSVYYRGLAPSQRTILEPMAATGENAVPHASESRPAIVIPAHCSDRSRARHVAYETLQRIKAAFRQNTGLTREELQRLAGPRLGPEQIDALHADVAKFHAERNQKAA